MCSAAQGIEGSPLTETTTSSASGDNPSGWIRVLLSRSMVSPAFAKAALTAIAGARVERDIPQEEEQRLGVALHVLDLPDPDHLSLSRLKNRRHESAIEYVEFDQHATVECAP